MKIITVTMEHLGDSATVDDVALFIDAVTACLEDRPELTEDEAVACVWNEGDWTRSPYVLGLEDTDAEPDGFTMYLER